MSDLKEFSLSLSRKIEDAKDIAIISHVSPDGDNLGSLEGMYGYLESTGKNFTYIGNDSVPADFAFLPSTKHRIDIDTLLGKVFDLVIALDSSDIHRFGKAGEAIVQSAKCTANIDHHLSNTLYGDLNYVVPSATSTGEVLFTVLESLNARFTANMATGLYTAISTDTGSFQYDSVNGNTHRIIAKLYDYGCDHNIVVQSVYQSRSREKLALMTRVLSRIEFLADGKVAMAACTLEDLKKTGAPSEDTEGIVEQIRNIEGVEMAIFLKEKEDEVKLSFRSKSYLNCTEFAGAFGGGGHIRASGASASMTLSEVEETIKKLLEEKMELIRS